MMSGLLSLNTEISDLGDRAVGPISNLLITLFRVCRFWFAVHGSQPRSNQASRTKREPRTILSLAQEPAPAAEEGCRLAGDRALDCKPEGGCSLADRL